MVAALDLLPRFHACEARLRCAGAICTTISDTGSRYFDYGRDLKIRVADHPERQRRLLASRDSCRSTGLATAA
jgi:hypothetical protein